MKTTQLQNISKHIQQNDIDIAYRKLMDFVRDTNEMFFFQKLIDLTIWKESSNFSELDFKSRLDQLIQELSLIHI